MSNKRYPEEFKIEAVKQVTVAGHSVADVAERLGMTTHSLYAWIKRYGPDSEQHNQVVAESFFQLLKRERVKKKIYPSREAARMDLFDYIEMFYNTNRRHGSNGMLTPVKYELQYFMKLESV